MAFRVEVHQEEGVELVVDLEEGEMHQQVLNRHPKRGRSGRRS